MTPPPPVPLPLQAFRLPPYFLNQPWDPIPMTTSRQHPHIVPTMPRRCPDHVRQQSYGSNDDVACTSAKAAHKHCSCGSHSGSLPTGNSRRRRRLGGNNYRFCKTDSSRQQRQHAQEMLSPPHQLHQPLSQPPSTKMHPPQHPPAQQALSKQQLPIPPPSAPPPQAPAMLYAFFPGRPGVMGGCDRLCSLHMTSNLVRSKPRVLPWKSGVAVDAADTLTERGA